MKNSRIVVFSIGLKRIAGRAILNKYDKFA